MMSRIKNKMILETLLKASLFGTAAGFTLVGIAALIITIGNLPFLWPFYFLIWMVGFAPTTDIYFALNFPTDHCIAARLDKEWDTKEKFLTAETFKDKEGLIIEKQRESAKNELKAARKLPMRISVSTIPALLFGAAFCTGGLCSPLIKNSIRNTVKDPEKTDKKTDEYVKEAADLIAKSGAAKDLQEELLKILDNLQSQLEGDTDITSRQAKVDAAKLLVDEAVARANTSAAIGAALKEVTSTDDMDDIEQLLLQLAEAIINTDTSNAAKALKELKNLVTDKLASGSIEKSYGPYNSATSRLTTLVNSTLVASKVGPTNAMYIALNTFSKNLTTILKDYGIRYNEIVASIDEDYWSDKGIGTTTAESKTKQVFDTCIKELTDAINLEATNTQLGEEVKKLMDQMVDPSSNDAGNNNNGGNNQDDSKPGDDDNQENGNGNSNKDNDDNNGGEENGGEDPDNGNQGGQNQGGNEGNGTETGGETPGTGSTNGSGETNYAGKDKIFEDGEYQEYGNVIADKQGDAINDAADSSLSDVIGSYFDELYGNGNTQP